MSFLNKLFRSNPNDFGQEISPISNFLKRMSPNVSPRLPRKKIVCNFERDLYLETKNFDIPIAYKNNELIYVDPYIALAYLHDYENLQSKYRNILDNVVNIRNELENILTWFNFDSSNNCYTKTATCSYFSNDSSSEESFSWLEE